jgi:hypothetical protein
MQVLTMLSQDDSKIIKQGEELLKPFLKHPSCISQLFVQLAGSPDVQVRHHAALLLKKKLAPFYDSFAPAERQQLKAQILVAMQSEAERVVAKGIVGCVANLAKAVFATNDTWQELFATLLSLAQSTNPAYRSINYNLLEQLAETIASNLKPHMATIASLLSGGCSDPVQEVKLSAMQAVTSFIRNTSGSDEVMSLEPILPPLVSVMQACLAAGEEEPVAGALECIQEAASMEQPLINNHIESLVPFIVAVMEHKDYENQVKQAATFALISIIENRPKLLGKKNMVPPILNAMVTLIAASDGSEVKSLFQLSSQSEKVLNEDDESDEDFDEEEGDNRNPQYILDVMALNIPSKYFVQPALTICSQCMGAADPNHRKAGCFLLGVITEGCADSLRAILSQILPAVLASVQDPQFYVREVACFALGQMSEYCQPEILTYHKEVLPVMFNALSDERINVQHTSCYVLEFFCENLQPETLKPFLTPLLTKLCVLLQSPSTVTKEMALSAIAATAVAAEKEFLPFTDTVCSFLAPLMLLQEDKEMSLRGRALECLGHIAVAIDKDHFAKFFPMGMQSALQSLEMKSDLIKEHAYVFFANAGKIMTEDMAPYLPLIMPKIVEQIETPELEVADGSDDEQEDDEEDEDDEDGNPRFRVADGDKNTKKAAITALGALAQHGGKSFTPEYLDMGFQCLLNDGLETVHEEVRAEVLEVLAYMVWSAASYVGLSEAPEKGVSIPLSGALATMARVSLVALLKTMKHDDEKPVVAAAVSSVSDIIGRLGVAVLALPAGFDENDEEWKGMQVLPVLMECVTTLVMEKGICQKRLSDEGEDDDDDHDNLVMDRVSDLIGTLAKAMGPLFVPYFNAMAGPLLKFTKPQREHSDRSMAIGCFAEVIGEIGMDAMKYVEVLLPSIQSGLQDPMEGVRRNCAYLIGCLVNATGAAMAPNFGVLLQWLSPLCTRAAAQATSDAGGADIDNALSSVATMIRASKASVPLAQVLPVLLGSLPLRSDISEGENVFQSLCGLVLEGDVVAMQMLPQMLVAFGQTLAPGAKSDDDTKAVTSACIKQLAVDPARKDAFLGAVQLIPDVNMQQLLISVARGS